MKRSSYDKRDYAFGQMMLTQRTNIGLTQARLAELLHVSRRAIAEGEAGSTYPKAEHLKQLIALLGQPHPALTFLPTVTFEECRPGQVPAAQPISGRRVD